MGHTDKVVGTGMLRSFTLEREPEASVDEVLRQGSVVVFSSPTCPYCSQAIQALHAAGVEPVVVDAGPAARKELLELTGSSSVPSVFVKGTFIGGCNDGPEDWMGVNRCLQSGKIKELLGEQ